MGQVILTWIRSVWAILNGPNHDPVVIGLLFGTAALLFSHVTLFLSFRARLKDKDERIEDLVGQRNKFQDFVLKAKNIDRKSSQP
jgi:hypothetical protein